MGCLPPPQYNGGDIDTSTDECTQQNVDSLIGTISWVGNTNNES